MADKAAEKRLRISSGWTKADMAALPWAFSASLRLSAADA
jgi:hypothetical protein